MLVRMKVRVAHVSQAGSCALYNTCNLFPRSRRLCIVQGAATFVDDLKDNLTSIT